VSVNLMGVSSLAWWCLYPALSDNVRWRQVEPLVFSEVDGRRQMVFREDERGQVVDFCTSPMCIMALQKEPWWNSRSLQITWVGIFCAILLCALIGLPIAAVVQRGQANPPGSKLARLTAWLASVTFAAGAVMVGIGVQDPNWIVFETPPAIRAGLALWMVELVVSIGLVVFTVSAWRRKWWRLAGRVSLTVVCLAALGAALCYITEPQVGILTGRRPHICGWSLGSAGRVQPNCHTPTE
jgi:hypothetical protein